MQKGFTLIEILAVIFVVTIGVAGVFSLMQSTVSSSRLVSSQLTATYLAQEGIEIVRSIRDSNLLARKDDDTVDWDRYLEGGTYRTDYTELGGSDPLKTTSTDQPLRIDGDGYTYSGEEESRFSREIEINNIGHEQVVVTVKVSFNFKGQEKSITAKEILYNWKE